jgi:hypothetical protein
MTCTVHVFNNLTSVQKLDMALIMAESLAELHGFRGGVILHGDAHPVQWLRNARGQVKLNDFSEYILYFVVSAQHQHFTTFEILLMTWSHPFINTFSAHR